MIVFGLQRRDGRFGDRSSGDEPREDGAFIPESVGRVEFGIEQVAEFLKQNGADFRGIAAVREEKVLCQVNRAGAPIEGAVRPIQLIVLQN